jgi:hypothetical protein
MSSGRLRILDPVFDFIPQALRDHLGDETVDLLGDVVRIVERALDQVYEMDSRAYDPSVGDNAQLFGLGIWHHGWFAIEEALEAVEGVAISHEDNSHRVHLGELTVFVYKGGDDEVDSIYDVNLNGSATKREYVDRNQTQLFSLDDIVVAVDERAYELKTLWIAHFGNPRDGLVKIYLGAPSRDAEDRNEWAWHRRVGEPAQLAVVEAVPEIPLSFDAQPEPEIDLELAEDVEETRGTDGE